MTQEARYYYDCPINAAFMAKHHGIKFETSCDGVWRSRITGQGESGWKYEISFGWDEKLDKIYIHPESLPLLQPQVGDLVELHYQLSGTFPCVTVGQHMINSLESDVQTVNRIIQRNGTPFIMPERDE